MKEHLKRVLISIRNRWGLSNSINKSSNSSVRMLGNMISTSIKVTGNSKVIIEKDSRLRNASIIVKGNNNRVEIEEGVFFSGSIELLGDENFIRIGKNTRINGADFMVHNGTSVVIGSNSLFSTQIDVRTTDSHCIFDTDGERVNLDKNIIIGEHVWIGRMVSIMKGSIIGGGSVIGAMSLVSGSIQKGVIAAGIPAKTIKENISWKE